MSDFPQPPPWPFPDQPPPDSPQPPPPSPFPDQPPLEFPQPPRNGLGLAALILGLVGLVAGLIPFLYWFTGILGIIGLILGFIGRGRAKRGEATNGTVALWGIITSAVVVVILIVNLVVLITGWSFEFTAGPVVVGAAKPTAENTVTPPGEAPTQAQETGPAPGAGGVAFYDLAVGDCLADLMATHEEFFIVETVPCSQPHSEEIYAVVPFPEGDFPGDEAVDAQADKACNAEFESFVGLPYKESVLYYNYLWPNDEETWNGVFREVVCSVYDPAGDTTGTLADANR
jgi:hypothetical protein